MDKIILNSNMLPGKVGQPGTIEDLKRLSKLLKMDVANFGGKNFEGFPTGIADRIADILDRDYNKDTSTVYVFNDIALEQTYSLLSRGYKLKNIYLVFGKWEKHGKKVTASPDTTSFEIVKEHLKNNFKNKFNLLKLSDVYNMGNNNMNKFDLGIVNPPYEIGNAVITETMKHCDEAVVLMPLSRYKKDGLYKKIKNIDIIPMGTAGFEDADTTPHICELKSNYNNNFSYEEIQLYSYDQKWVKYYRENLKRKASWESKWLLTKKECLELPRDKTFCLTVRTGVDGVHKTSNCFDYIYNKTYEKIENNPTLNETSKGVVMVPWSIFNTTIEKQNCQNFWYSSKIMSEIAQGVNKQSISNINSFFPKVDWTKPWTDEEILKDYGYTNEEIKEILK